jgi:hypothetical protein
MRWMTAAALLVSASVWAEAPALFTLADPRGDDRGDGALVYPLRDDLRGGDLDLVSLTAWADPEGTAFEATFARPIARPGSRTIDIAGTQLDAVAKLGFYTFNLEIYVDVDRVPGSGRVAMLPGRKAEIDPGSAWEKLIVLAPRPFELRSALKRMKRSALVQALGTEALEERVFFVPRAKVTGNSVRFVVPTSFLGGAVRPEWAYAVAVTGADVAQRLDLQSLGLFGGSGPEALGIIPLSGGAGPDRFGGAREGDPLHPPLVDLVVPPGASQEAVLKDDDPKASRPVRLPGVVPAPASSSSGSASSP